MQLRYKNNQPKDQTDNRLLSTNHEPLNTYSGFTIVELLVVIVVIGIIAAITLVSYTGISQKATIATLQSDLSNGANKLKMYYIENGSYPTSMTNDGYGNYCPTPSDARYCIKASLGTTFDYPAFTPGSSPQTFVLNATSTNAITYRITNNTGPVAYQNGWLQVSSGESGFSCAIAIDNRAYCWGVNEAGVYQLGNNTSTESHVPVAVYSSGVLSGKTILAIATGYAHTCVIASDNKVYCWGFNSQGQLGNNSTTSSSVPVAVNTAGVLSGKTILSISAGAQQTCVIASDNNAYCWGYNNYGQLGNNSVTRSLVPVAVDTSGVLSGKTVLSISAGGYAHVCVIASDNNAYCWGYNVQGQLGNNSVTLSKVPVAVDTSGVLSGKTILSISAGNTNMSGNTCVIASDNNAYCWGAGSWGQLGNNLWAESHVPVAVDTSGVLSGKTILSISASYGYTCAIASNNQAYCWGYNSIGRLGNNSTTSSSVPVAVNTAGVLSGKTILLISSGSDHSCVIASDNNAYCWGYNYFGQLGNNSTTESYVPVATQSAP